MQNKSIKFTIVIALLMLATVVACSTESKKQVDEAQATPQSILESELQKAKARSDSDLTTGQPSQVLTENQNTAPDKEEDTILIGGKHLSVPKPTGSVSPRNDDYHDTENNAIVVLQSPTNAMKDFPRDRRNEVDWVKTLDGGFIEPRADIQGKGKMTVMDLDIIMKNTQFMPHVRFPHKAHTRWLACDNCHPKIFVPQENANPISMNKVLRGEYCGVCHDKVAFSLFVCERCHSVPHAGSGPAWWKK